MTRMLQKSTLIRACFNASLFCIAKLHGLDPRRVAQCPLQPPLGNRPFWLEAMRARRQAIYLVITLMDVPQSDVARALNIARWAVGRMMRQVEDERDDPAIDRALDELSFLGGEAA